MKKRYQTIAVSALAALWLSACGGGGGDGPAPAPTPSAPAVGSPSPSSPAPTPAPTPAPSTVLQISSNTAAVANRQYQVTANGGAGVVVTLPTQIATGDTVKVTGVGTSPWTLQPNTNQTIVTTGVTGNVAPGASWTPHLDPKTWHWVSTNTTGSIIVAGSIPGSLDVSRDGGTTWTTGAISDTTDPVNWISVDMTPTGDRMVALGYLGNMYLSTDVGATWTPVAGTGSGVSFTGREWESVTMSQDGQRIVAVIMNGPIVVSSDGGATWSVGTATGATNAWRAVDSSANGSVVVAGSQSGDLWISNGTPGTFTRLNVTVGGVAVNDTWYRVAVSADGNTIVAAGNTQYPTPPTSSTGLYVSHDRGVTWTRASELTGDYTSVSVSADGSVIGATLSGVNGQAIMSRDGGVTFNPVTPSGTTETMWRNMAMSADGNSFVLAAGTFFGAAGQLYTSMGNRTSYGALGSLGGGQNQSVQVQYLGGGRFQVTSSTGGAFTIR